jgi:hypothetical protein
MHIHAENFPDLIGDPVADFHPAVFQVPDSTRINPDQPGKLGLCQTFYVSKFPDGHCSSLRFIVGNIGCPLLINSVIPSDKKIPFFESSRNCRGRLFTFYMFPVRGCL